MYGELKAPETEVLPAVATARIQTVNRCLLFSKWFPSRLMYASTRRVGWKADMNYEKEGCGGECNCLENFKERCVIMGKVALAATQRGRGPSALVSEYRVPLDRNPRPSSWSHIS